LGKLGAALQPWEGVFGRVPIEVQVRLSEEGENLRQRVTKFSREKMARMGVEVGHGLDGYWVRREGCDFVGGS